MSTEPRWVDANVHHWVGESHGVLVTILFEGSHDDPTHVDAAVRLVRRMTIRGRERLNLLAILSPDHRRPPSAAVRRAIVDAAGQVGDRIERLALVLPGSGFLDAIHRGAATGVLTLTRVTTWHRVTNDLDVGSAFVAKDDDTAASLAGVCRGLLARETRWTGS